MSERGTRIVTFDVPPSVHRTGIDLVSVPRFARLLGSVCGLPTIFTPGELRYCRGRSDAPAHLAARFAAKEAALKALGMGLGLPPSRTSLREVEVVSGGWAPALRLCGKVAQRAQRLGLTGGSLTLTHSAGIAMAQVLLVCSEVADD